eukprot:14283353-Alexandrium_andersonii.AAC.1
MQEDVEAATLLRSKAPQPAAPAAHGPWGPAAWAATGGPLLPPNDPRASLSAGLQAGVLLVDVVLAG